MKDVVSILIAGDFYGGGRTDKLITDGQYSDLFRDAVDEFREADLSIVNLESALITSGIPIQKTGPAIKADPRTADALKYAGFNTVTLANNHIMDFGVKGLQSTIEACQNSGIECVGAGLSLETAAEPLIKTIRGVSVAILNVCENEWSTTGGDYPGANPIDLIRNAKAISSLRTQVDYVVVIYHGGNELYSLPSPRMQEYCRFLADSGADLVACHHAHYYSGFESYRGSLIFYGLGNFIFDHPRFRSSKWNRGFALKLAVTKEGLRSHQLIPFVQSDMKPGISLLSGEETRAFNENFEALSKVIANEIMLKHEFDAFCKRAEKQYLNYLQPYSNRILNALYKRGFLPSLLTRDKKLLYTNLIRCEAHRDVLLNILNQ